MSFEIGELVCLTRLSDINDKFPDEFRNEQVMIVISKKESKIYKPIDQIIKVMSSNGSINSYYSWELTSWKSLDT